MRRFAHAAALRAALILFGLAAGSAGWAQTDANPASNAAIARLAAELRPQAEAAGVSRPTFEAAFAGLTPDPKVLALAGRQGEFSRPISAYVQDATSAARIAQGRSLAAKWASVLAQVKSQDGVPPEIILAIWATESGYGAGTGGFNTIRSLATQTVSGERTAFFRRELLAALVVLEQERMPASRMTGSWAGAVGQPQFMPSSFLKYAADGDGDGRRDIWTSVPDVLASISRFLGQEGWRRGLPWGMEVTLPARADISVHERDFAEWGRLGLRRTDGAPLPPSGKGRLFLPAGIRGPAFLLTENWEVVRAYNTSDSYALGIGHLADRIAGGSALSQPWPRDPILGGDERREVHRRLAALGLYAGAADGKFGAVTRDAVRRFQISRALVPDGYADRALLEALRAKTQP
jgi:lytic murein transglycosylase